MLSNLNKAEPFDIYIGRMKKSHLHFGNPFIIGQHGTREECVAYYEEWLRGTAFLTLEPERRSWIVTTLPRLKGRVLGCYCKPLICHGDVLLKLIQELPNG